MTELVACLGIGKGSWKYMQNLIKSEEWENVFLITNTFGAEKFFIEATPINFIIINENNNVFELVDSIYNQLKERIQGTEVAVNFISGSGKEHMALLSALLRLGLGIRMVGLKDGRVKEL